MRFMIGAAVAVVIAGLPALAESPEPDHAHVVLAGEACTAAGAFGYRFGEKSAILLGWTGIPPFAVETVSTTHRDHLVFEVTAVASFAKARMSGEDRIAMANWFFRALDTEVTAEHRFASRDERRDGVTYRSGADVGTGYTLDLSHDGTSVRIDCTDVGLKRRAWTQMREKAEP